MSIFPRHLRTTIHLCFGLAALLAAAAPAEAQSYKVFAGRALIDSATNTVVAVGCAERVMRYGLRADGRGGLVFSGLPFRLGVNCQLGDDFRVGSSTLANMAVSPDGRHAYFVDPEKNALLVLDTLTNQWSWSGVTGIPSRVVNDDLQGLMLQSPGPTGLLMAPDGSALFVAATNDPDHNRLSRINTATMSPDYVVSNVDRVSALALRWSSTPNARRLYLANENRASISVFQANLMEFVQEIPISAARAAAIVVNPEGTRLYVAGFDTPVIDVIDLATNQKIKTLALPPMSLGVHPVAMAITPDGRSLYMSRTDYISTAPQPVVVVDTTTGAVTTIATGGEVADIAVAPVAFSNFDASVRHVSAGLSLSGTFLLGAGTNGIDPGADHVTLTIGHRVLWLEPKDLRPDPASPGAFRFQGYAGDAADVFLMGRIAPGNGPSEFRIDVTLQIDPSSSMTTIDLGSEPLETSLVIGDDAGIAALDPSAEFDTVISGLQSQLSAGQAFIAALNAQNDRLVAEMAHLEEALAAASSNNATLTSANAALTDANVGLTAANATLTDANAGLTASNAALQSDLAAMRDVLSSTAAELATTQLQLAGANTIIATKDALIVQQGGVISTLATENLSLQAALTAAQGEIGAVTASLAAANGQVAELMMERDALRMQLAGAAGTIAAREATIAERDQQLAALTGANASLQDQLANANGRIDALTGELAAAHLQVATLTSERDALQAQLDAATAVVATQGQQITTQGQQLAQQASTIETLNGRVSALNGEIAALTAERQALQTRLDAATAAVASTLSLVETTFRRLPGGAAFRIPGQTREQQLTNLATAVATANQGSQIQVYRAMGGR